MPRTDHSAREGAASRFGILGGTFDPPHLGHLVIAQEAQARLDLDRVLFVPAAQPPHKANKAISPAQHRRAMVELAIEDNPHFALSTVDLDRSGPSYSVDTLRLLRASCGPDAELHFILGWDMLLDLPTWHEPAGIVAAATRLVAFHRPGYEADPTTLARLSAALPELPLKLTRLPMAQLDISASDLRQRVASGLPIRYLVPDTVIQYIVAHDLYRGTLPSLGATSAAVDTTEHHAGDAPHPHHGQREEARP